MDLYFAPLACSLATRIALYEAGADARYIQVDTHAKRLPDGGDYYAINPMGQVPVLRTDEGELLSENTAVLQYVAERFPDAKLAPPSGFGRHRLRQGWPAALALPRNHPRHRYPSLKSRSFRCATGRHPRA